MVHWPVFFYKEWELNDAEITEVEQVGPGSKTKAARQKSLMKKMTATKFRDAFVSTLNLSARGQVFAEFECLKNVDGLSPDWTAIPCDAEHRPQWDEAEQMYIGGWWQHYKLMWDTRFGDKQTKEPTIDEMTRAAQRMCVEEKGKMELNIRQGLLREYPSLGDKNFSVQINLSSLSVDFGNEPARSFDDTDGPHGWACYSAPSGYEALLEREARYDAEGMNAFWDADDWAREEPEDLEAWTEEHWMDYEERDYVIGEEEDTKLFNEAQTRYMNAGSSVGRMIIAAFVRQYCLFMMISVPVWLVMASRGRVLKEPARLFDVIPSWMRAGHFRKQVEVLPTGDYTDEKYIAILPTEELFNRVMNRVKLIKVDGWKPVRGTITTRVQRLGYKSGTAGYETTIVGRANVHFDEQALEANAKVPHKILMKYATCDAIDDGWFREVNYTFTYPESQFRELCYDYLKNMEVIASEEIGHQFIMKDVAFEERSRLVQRIKNYLSSNKKPLGCLLLVASLIVIGVIVWYKMRQGPIEEADDFAKGKQKSKAKGGKQRKTQYWIDYHNEEKWMEDMKRQHRDFHAERLEDIGERENGQAWKSTVWGGSYTHNGKKVHFTYDPTDFYEQDVRDRESGLRGDKVDRYNSMQYFDKPVLMKRAKNIVQAWTPKHRQQHLDMEDLGNELGLLKDDVEATVETRRLTNAEKVTNLSKIAKRIKEVEETVVETMENLADQNVDAVKVNAAQRRVYSLHPTQENAINDEESIGNAISTLGGLLLPYHMSLKGLGKVWARGFSQAGEPQIVPVDLAKASESGGHPLSKVCWKPTGEDMPDGWGHRFVASHEVSTKSVKFLDPVIGERVLILDPTNNGREGVQGTVVKTEQVRTPQGNGLSYRVKFDNPDARIDRGSCNGIAVSVERNVIVGYIHAGNENMPICFIQPAGWMSAFNAYY